MDERYDCTTFAGRDRQWLTEGGFPEQGISEASQNACSSDADCTKGTGGICLTTSAGKKLCYQGASADTCAKPSNPCSKGGVRVNGACLDTCTREAGNGALPYSPDPCLGRCEAVRLVSIMPESVKISASATCASPCSCASNTGCSTTKV